MFKFKLAAKLGCTVKELLARMDSKELSEWMAYNSIDPFTENRADMRQAITSRILAAGLLKKQFCNLDDFMPIRKPVEEMSIEQMKNILRNFTG